MIIALIYSAGLKSVAEKTIKKSLELENAEIVTNDDGYAVINIQKGIPCDSTIVFVTDDVLHDKKWNERVNSLTDATKIVLASRLVSHDIHISELTPQNIQKINSVIINGNDDLDELWDVLVTDKDVYSVLNTLYAGYESYKSGADSHLGLRQIIRYKKKINAISKVEKRDYYRSKIKDIRTYLNSMLFNEIFQLLKSARFGIPIIFFMPLLCLYIISAVFQVPEKLSLATNAAAVCGIESNTTGAPVQALKAIESIRNPLVKDELKIEAFKVLNMMMCDNWPNSLIGINYGYMQNDMRICTDERYIYAASGDGCCILWDTYTGSIVSKEKLSDQPMYVIDIEQNEKNIICVDEAGSVFRYSDGQWRSANNLIADYGYAVGVSLEGDRATVRTNKEKVVLLDLSNCKIKIEQSFSFDRIFEITQTNECTVLVVSDKGKNKIIEAFPDGNTDEVMVIDYELPASCKIDIKGDRVLFADRKGYIHICNIKEKKTDLLPVVLSEPLVVRFINDNAIYYCDRNKGNCLFDYAHGIDLGSFLPEAGSVSYAVCSGNTVAVRSENIIKSENIEDLLPKEKIDSSSVVESFDSPNMLSSGRVQSVEIIDEKYVLSKIKNDDGSSYNYLIDGGHYYFYTNPDQRAGFKDIKNLKFVYSQPSEVVYTGGPTVVGILNDGMTMVIGASDGSFFELSSYGTQVTNVTEKKIPSASAIVRIHLMNDCFYLEDSKGLFWKARYGSRTIYSDEVLYEEIRNKLHYAMDESIKTCVSDFVLKKTGVVYVPERGKEQK